MDEIILYALNLDPETNRILSATYDQYAPPSQPRVTYLPEGNINDYLYQNFEYVYDPLPEPEPEPVEPTQVELDIAELKAQNEMLLECILEMSELLYE